MSIIVSNMALIEIRDFYEFWLKISISTEPIEFSIVWNLYIGPMMVLGYIIFKF